MEFKHGDYVTCKINGTVIKKGRITLHNGEYAVCQNEVPSNKFVRERFGYEYATFVGQCKDIEAYVEPEVIRVSVTRV